MKELWRKKTFILDISSKETTEEVLDLQFDFKNPNINSKNFPMRPRTGKAKIALSYIKEEMSFEEVLKGAFDNELGRPTYEDALLFAKQNHDFLYPEGDEKIRTILFLHKQQVFNRQGQSLVICFCTDKDAFTISLQAIDSCKLGNVYYGFIDK
jgi:hypothetical protein